MKVRLIVKIAVLAAVVFSYNAVMNFIAPIAANELAMMQMSNAVDSSLCLQLYTYFSTGYAKVALAIFIAVLFSREVREFFEKGKGKRNEEE